MEALSRDHVWRTRLRNARIATCAGQGESDEAKLDVRERCSLVIENGRITYLGPDAECPRPPQPYNEDVDLGGRLITPGLVDPHTHLVFAGTRSNDFRAKMEGVDYRTIAQRGGGIMASVHATRAAPDAQLQQLVLARFFAEQLLPATTGLLGAATGGSRDLVALDL